MIPPDAPLQGRYSTLTLARLHVRQFRRCEGDWRYRVRWSPVQHWPEHPWGIFAFPYWRRYEADAIDAKGELVWPELIDHLWGCPECGATWQLGLRCPNCFWSMPRDQWPPLEPVEEDTWLTLN